MVVSNDVAISRNDYARARALLLGCAILTFLLSPIALIWVSEKSEWITKEIVERVALHLHGLHLTVACAKNVYHRRKRFLGSVCKVYGLSWCHGCTCRINLNKCAGRERQCHDEHCS